MIKKVDHIGIAVNDIEEAAKLYTGTLGLKVQSIETVEEQKARTAIIPVGETKVELVESTDPEGPIAKYIQKRGEGLHHVAFEVEDIERAIETLKGKSMPLIDERPRRGVENTKVAFLHPKGAKILLELVELEE